MNKLIITQSSNNENVSGGILKKLYELAINTAEGDATISGNLTVDYCYRKHRDYLLNRFGVDAGGNLVISTPQDYYVDFGDNVFTAIIANIVSSTTGFVTET